MKKAAAVLKNLLFPRRCPYCGQVVGFAPACACAPRVEACRLCGPSALLDGEGRKLAFLDGGAACYAYTGPIREGIRRLKFASASGLTAPYGHEMAAKLTALLPNERFDGVVPVPSTEKERRRRGYDVPLLLARALSEALAIPLWDDILVKEFETKRQHELPLAERKGNLLGAFGLRGDAALSGRRVLLCDDVATSGATLDECAKMLKAGGAAAVWGVVFASTPRQEARKAKEREHRHGTE